MKRSYFTVVLVLLTVSLHAQQGQWEFQFGPRIWGATVAGRYMLEPPAANAVETSITGLLSGAYQSVGYYRAPDGSLYVAPSTGALSTSYSRADVVWQAGVQQGILPRADAPADAAVGFLFYRGQYDLPFESADQLFFQSGLPETDDSLVGSIIGGLAYQVVLTDEITRARDGVAGELAVEWGPSFLHNQIRSNADYTRLTLSARGFLPLYEVTPAAGMNVFSSYLAGYASVDWATGPEIPLSVRQTTGGRSVRSAPGGAVRGYASGRFDAPLKTIGNVEVRNNLPAIVWPGLVPGVVLYTDAGYYFDTLAISPDTAEHNGLLLSSGAGISLDLFGVASFVFYTNYLWTATSVDGERWIPFSLGFGFHY